MNPQNLTFKERDATTGLHLTYSMADIPAAEYEKLVMRAGWFSIGFHYIIHPDGSAEAGLPITQHADPSIEGWRDKICLLLMGAPEGHPTALQCAAVNTIAQKHNLPLIF